MPRPKREWRGDQIYCRGHDEWHHHSRFRRRRRENPHADVWDYDPDCRLWQQTQRVASKHDDEARRIVEGRAKKIVTKANKAGEPKIGLDFVMGALNYTSLIPMVRATIAWPDECVCPNCGSSFDKPIELDHRAPPRDARDWARLHARNIGPLDHECNTSKSDMSYEAWLELEEDKRLSAQAHNDNLAQASELRLNFDFDQGTFW